MISRKGLLSRGAKAGALLATGAAAAEAATARQGATVTDSPYISNFGQLITIPATDFGAAFDDVADDTAAIQAAINAAAVNAYEATNPNDYKAIIVQLPPGSGIISEPLKMHANVIVQGHGPGATYVRTEFGDTPETPALQLSTGAEVQCGVRDLGLILNGPRDYGIYFVQSGGASITGDTLHVFDNIVIEGGAQAFQLYGSTECRIDNIYCARQTPLNDPDYGSFVLGGTDHMVSRITVSAPQHNGKEPGGAAFRLSSSNTKYYSLKAFGGNASKTSQMQPAFSVAGFRNQFVALEAQDYGGSTSVLEDSGGNVYLGFVADSCQGGAIYTGPGSIVVRGGNFIGNRGGGRFTMPWVIYGGGAAGNDIEGQLAGGLSTVFSGTPEVGQRIIITGAGNNASRFPIQTSGALNTISLTSGTPAQVSTTRDVTLSVILGSPGGSVTLSLSPDGMTYTDVISQDATDPATVAVMVPCGWYVQIKTGAVITRAVYW